LLCQLSNETRFWNRIQNYQEDCLYGRQVGSAWLASFISSCVHEDEYRLFYGGFVISANKYNVDKLFIGRLDDVCVYVCDCNGCLSISASVVTFCQRLQSMEMAASVRRRLRAEDRGKRSSAQTVTLRPKQCRAEPLAIEGPSAGGWHGYLQPIGYAIASAWSYRVSPAPGCS
jgi:hypothetical protein